MAEPYDQDRPAVVNPAHSIDSAGSPTAGHFNLELTALALAIVALVLSLVGIVLAAVAL